MKLDEKLVRLRKEKGLTQLELAEAVKVSRQAVSKWESGGGVPSTENLRGLSELYGVSVDYLLNEEEQKPENGNAPKNEPENNPAPVREERRGVPIPRVGCAVVNKAIKLVIPIFLIVVLLAIFFCFMPSNISESNEIQITATPIGSNSIQITILNNSSCVVTFQNDYHIEVKSGFGWRKIGPISAAFTSLGHTLKPGEGYSTLIDYENACGILSSGEYRFVRKFTFANHSANFAGCFSIE